MASVVEIEPHGFRSRQAHGQSQAAVRERGGTDSLKEDAGELKDIATGDGSVTDKGKAAVSAVQDPGAPDPDR